MGENEGEIRAAAFHANRSLGLSQPRVQLDKRFFVHGGRVDSGETIVPHVPIDEPDRTIFRTDEGIAWTARYEDSAARGHVGGMFVPPAYLHESTHLHSCN